MKIKAWGWHVMDEKRACDEMRDMGGKDWSTCR